MTDNSDFEKFGIAHLVKQTKIPDFIQNMESGVITATKCKSCDTTYFPPKGDCPKCLRSDMEWVGIKEPGRLVTYTVVNYGPSGFEDRCPYILALAEFEGDTKVLALMDKAVQEKDVHVGIKVRLTVSKPSPDSMIYSLERV